MNNFMAMLSKNKSGILFGLGIGSMLTAVVASWVYSPMAHDAIEEKKEELGVEKLPVGEAIKTVAPYAVTPVAFTAAGIVSFAGAHKANLDNLSAAMATIALNETTNTIYREKTKELAGDQKERKIREAVAKEIANQHPIPSNGVIVTGKGDCLCYDDVTNQYFRSDINFVKSTINNLNFEMLDSRSNISVDDYCLAMGQDTVLLGNELFWSMDTTGIINPDYTAVLKDGEPCLVITHTNHPPKPRV